MITLKEARTIAADRLREIDSCTEYTTAYVFFNSKAEEADGGPDSPVVVLNPEAEQDEFMDDMCLVRGTVKKALWGRFKLEDDEQKTYISCMIDTEFGELEIVFDPYELPEEQRVKIRVGTIISVICALSGDVAIKEYEHGLVRDEAHDLAVLRHVFCGGDPERLRSILTDDAVYTAEYNKTTYRGSNDIVERLKFVQIDHPDKYFAHFATITSVGEGNEGDKALEYEVGKRCLVLASGNPDEYESIAFIETDKDGNISRILTSTESRYRFQLDKTETKNPLDDIEVPNSVSKLIVNRAKWIGILGDEIDDTCLSENTKSDMKENIVQMLDAMPTVPEEEREILLTNLFGYLFAKSIEMEYVRHHIEVGKWIRVSYLPSDAWAGRFETSLGEHEKAKLEEAMEKGKKFYKDYHFWREDMDRKEVESEEETLITALTTVQMLGRVYSRQCLGWE